MSEIEHESRVAVLAAATVKGVERKRSDGEKGRMIVQFVEYMDRETGPTYYEDCRARRESIRRSHR